MIYGYVRVSTNHQDTELQRLALESAGCERIFEDKISGTKSDRPGLKKLLRTLSAGDTLAVWKHPVSVEVQSVTDGVKVKVSRVPDGVAGYSVWGLKLPTLRQRLFRCVSIRENDDGTYAITAVQHVPEKEAIVDNGAHFDGDQSGTVNGVTPPAVQHLTAEVTADSGEYQVLARWDTPKVVKGVSFMLRLTVAADDGSERLVSTARTTETTYRFTQLALGNYRLTVRAVNAWGQQGDPASVSFRIAAPAAPSRIELTPGYFQITATPHLAVYDPTVQFEKFIPRKIFHQKATQSAHQSRGHRIPFRLVMP